MGKQDYFAEIAMTKHPMNGSDVEIMPVEVGNVIFEEVLDIPNSVREVVPVWEKSQGARLEEFEERLRELRGEYAPFMENRIGDFGKIKSVSFRDFEFAYLTVGVNLEWEKVQIPDYRGPVGKWKGQYKTTFWIDEIGAKEVGVLCFQCVDYKANIYVNGSYVGSHEGFFAPFSFDVTAYLNVRKENELIVEVVNDVSILGEGAVLDGDKIYGATGPGWDDPELGWHHCPAGAGLFGKVTLKYQPQICIEDLFVRPNIDEHYLELRVGVMNYTSIVKENHEFEVCILPKNFEGSEVLSYRALMKTVGVGQNEYRYFIPIKEYRLWELETPYLYGACCEIKKENQSISKYMGTFGMRKFVSDETTLPKGKFFFNNRPMMLRGANEMGHLQQCVMNHDFDQLVDDILIAKICNVNYYRLTQRPVQQEIYDYMDMLGIMHQTDLPLFSFLRRNQVWEAVKQAGEMEKLIRSHPSSIMVSFINEPVCIRRTQDANGKYSKRYEIKGHRHLLRDELEAFFVAARKIIYIENPDRVIKNVEGDYDPPTSEGLPDFHCYTMWYSNHAMPIGKLYKGYLPPVKEEWMIGCGEYGAEGLDHADLMKRRYPKEWISPRTDGSWYPDKIVRAQTCSVQGDWYKEQHTMEDWVEESQKHQANATSMMTDAFRRRGDVMNQTAIHLLIDAWPAGWMKTLVDCERKPKKAFFAYQDSLVPLRIHFRCDRRYVYEKECLAVEGWLLNDTKSTEVYTLIGCLCEGNPKDNQKKKRLQSFQLSVSAKEATAFCAGYITVNFPAVEEATIVYLEGFLLNKQQEVMNMERMEFVVYPKGLQKEIRITSVGALGNALQKEFAYPVGEDCLLISDFTMGKTQMEEWLCNGKSVVWIADSMEQQTYEILGETFVVKACPEVFFLATSLSYVKYHLNMLYNQEADYIDFIGTHYIESSIAGNVYAYSYAKSGFAGVSIPKKQLPMVETFSVGKGKLTVVTLQVAGRYGVNANLDQLLKDLLGG